MKFHVFVLQVNGDVTDREEFDTRKVQSNPIARQWIEWFSALLVDRFADNPEKRGKFQAPIGESDRYRLNWQQLNPLSALCVINVAGRPWGACLMLYGFEPLHDAAAVQALQGIMVKWLANTPIEPGIGLLQITERPAIIPIPFRTDVDESDQKAVSNILYLLGIAFFGQAAAFLDEVDRFWESLGAVRDGPKPNWPRP